MVVQEEHGVVSFVVNELYVNPVQDLIEILLQKMNLVITMSHDEN